MPRGPASALGEAGGRSSKAARLGALARAKHPLQVQVQRCPSAFCSAPRPAPLCLRSPYGSAWEQLLQGARVEARAGHGARARFSPAVAGKGSPVRGAGLTTRLLAFSCRPSASTRRWGTEKPFPRARSARSHSCLRSPKQLKKERKGKVVGSCDLRRWGLGGHGPSARRDPRRSFLACWGVLLADTLGSSSLIFQAKRQADGASWCCGSCVRLWWGQPGHLKRPQPPFAPFHSPRSRSGWAMCRFPAGFTCLESWQRGRRNAESAAGSWIAVRNCMQIKLVISW